MIATAIFALLAGADSCWTSLLLATMSRLSVRLLCPIGLIVGSLCFDPLFTELQLWYPQTQFSSNQ